MATTQYTLTQAAGTSAKKLTVSMWFKVGDNVTAQGLWSCGTGTSDGINLNYTSDGKLQWNTYNGSVNPSKQTTAIYKDTSAWYHVVVNEDTTNTTDSEKMRIYINGAEVTATLDSGDYPPVEDSDIPGWSGSGDVMRIGNRTLDGDGFWTGLMAHVHVIDGTIYGPSSFGEADATSGIWVPKTGPSVTYGTNGGFYKFVSGALTTDSSGEGNTLTQVGTPTTTLDTPNNNFCTINPNDGNITTYSGGTLNANTTWNKSRTGVGTNTASFGNLAPSKSKWYWEVKIGDTNTTITGFTNLPHGPLNSNWSVWNIATTESYGWLNDGTKYVGDTTTSSFFNTFTTNDILSFAIDLDNGKCYAAKNGVWENSGDPTSGATGTGSFADITDLTLFYTPAIGNNNYGEAGLAYYNFGTGYFGSTAVTSGNADDAGEGDFEYDVPAGYYALCTKNLATYG